MNNSWDKAAEVEEQAIADLNLIMKNPSKLEVKQFVVAYLKGSLAVSLRENELMKDTVVAISERTERMKRIILKRRGSFTVDEWFEIVECLALNVNDHV